MHEEILRYKDVEIWADFEMPSFENVLPGAHGEYDDGGVYMDEMAPELYNAVEDHGGCVWWEFRDTVMIRVEA